MKRIWALMCVLIAFSVYAYGDTSMSLKTWLNMLPGGRVYTGTGQYMSNDTTNQGIKFSTAVFLSTASLSGTLTVPKLSGNITHGSGLLTGSSITLTGQLITPKISGDTEFVSGLTTASSMTLSGRARISYGGRGRLTEIQQPPYGQQVMDLISPI